MSKPKMKKIDLNSVGGRIRKARTDSSLTIKELSKRINISLTYLGMIERGERNPSDQMLACIAEVTGTPVDWLQNVDNNSVDDKPRKSNQPQTPFYIADIDASLFLSLLMCEEPSVSEETIATFLNVDQGTLKNILDGTIKFDPAWKSAFTTLAQRLKIPDVLNRLHAIESFLEHVETERVDIALIKAIGRSLSEKFQGEFICSGQSYNQENYIDIKESYKGDGIPVRSFTFMQKSTRWNVELYSELHGSTLEQLISMLRCPSDNIVINEEDDTAYIDDSCGITNEVLVFIKEENFREACSYSDSDKPARGNDNSPRIAVMLLDPDSMRITDCEEI